MKDPENRRNRILNQAWRLFLARGFGGTSMRQIAEAAGVSLGLVTYYFATKETVALEILNRFLGIFKEHLERAVDVDEDPLLYSASLVRLNYRVMSSPPFELFYKDAMRNDLYFRTIPEDRGSNPDESLRSLRRINEKYGLGHSDEYLELFGTYLCVSMERTLVLYPKTRAVGHIPDLVFRTYMGHLDPGFADFETYCRRSDALVEGILREHPELLEVRDLFEEPPRE